MGDVYTVEQFMRFALYHPRVGYYSRRVRGIGRRGDFATSPTLSPALAVAAAQWARSLPCNRGLVRAWHVIEVGAGDGSLAEAFCGALGPMCRARLRYHIVEASPPLREIQARRLRGRRFRWHGDMAGALAASGGRATIIANEVADAFPATQWEWSGTRWREVGVRLGDGDPEEVALEPDMGRALRWCPECVQRHARALAGDRFEMHLSYAEWLASWAPSWARGAMLTIDYGGEDLVPRQGGSLRAYWHHQSLKGLDIYLRPGRQDLTADVDFADLARWGEILGLRNAWSGTQSDFIRNWSPRAARDPIAAALADPGGAGGAFRVLDQRREAAR